MNKLKNTLSTIIYQLVANALLKSGLLGIAVGMMARLCGFSPELAGIFGLLGFGIGAWFTGLFQDKKPQAIGIMHRLVGDAEYSLPLLEKDELNIAEQLQLARLNERVQTVRIPASRYLSVIFSKTGFYGLLVLLSVAVYYGYPLLQSNPVVQKQLTKYIPVLAKDNRPVAPTFQSALLQIQPPDYTGLPIKESSDLNAAAVSGSLLKWQLTFSESATVSVRLVNSRGEEVAFKKAGAAFEYRDKLVSSGIYALKGYWKTPVGKDSLIYQSDYYRLEAQPDLAPKIQPDSKEVYRFHFLKDDKNLRISARISDDFKVRQAFIVATVARGSGESVKFREVKFALPQTNFKEAQLTKIIDLKALNFAPGDELYYYWAAIDNKEPEANFAKSDTYFVVYKDTARVEEAELATMAVNIMPEYFRSQRQIIIDTEKLIAKRKKLAAKDFKSTSNEIGFDQKVLRLRYGQYLGEEFENSIGGHDLVAEGNVLEGFIHKHDTEEEKNAPKPFAFKLAEKAEEQQKKDLPAPDAHGHDHDNQGKSNNEDPVAALMEQYIHAHDDAETNTFYEQSTRSLLKMALEQMWQSELHLRLYEPEKALPFENKALVYLKAAQHKARTFVKKSGYDPPPIKEKETRLTGELKKVNTNLNQERIYDPVRTGQLVGEVLGYLELKTLDQNQKKTVQQLSSSLTNDILNSGLSNWSVISGLQKLGSGKNLSDKERVELKTKLYGLAAGSSQTTKRSGLGSYSSEKKLEQSFWRHLK
ncbi:DUF4175 domain-containing protein [Larkinella humicola]|uniref:DUF4175 domain-containing protein n=1 Tax=Larkinella humicola TaxID=2607654 RepID=A0A5N1JIK0_9BACT|nr:DUF4175 domain-containing protein [Larkinella humicola]KAA9354992.1 DUF4175 domain-containing protein [Larkinella humicola]